MYGIGDVIIYGIHGVCRVADSEERVVDRKRVTYLVLEPDGQQGTRYLVPTHNASAMSKIHPVLTEPQLEELFSADMVHEDHWIRDENQRKQAYRDLIVSGDRAALMGMVASLYHHKEAQTAAGRKCHQSDENFLRDAEKLLSGEVALVKGISAEEAREYLRRRLREA